MDQNKKSMGKEPFNFGRKVSSFWPLNTKNLLMRDISSEEIKIIRGWFSSRHLWRLYYHSDNYKVDYSGWPLNAPHPPFLFYEGAKEIKNYSCLSVIMEDELIGAIELYDYDSLEKSCYVGILIPPDHKHSYLLLADLLFLLAELLFECLELHSIYVTVDKDRKKLIRLVESCTGKPCHKYHSDSMVLEFKIKRESALKKKSKFAFTGDSKMNSILLKSLLRD